MTVEAGNSIIAFDPTDLRRIILDMAFKSQCVHVPCAFSLIEVYASLFSKWMRYNPKNPSDSARDYLVLSKGHGVMGLYACFKKLSWLSQDALDNYLRDGTQLFGLAEYPIPGIEVSAGSLGHGLPIAVGMAFGLKRKGSKQKVFCIVGDGEMNEGSMWEAILFSAHHKLDNLVMIIDANEFQAMGRVEDILNLEPFGEKLRSFGMDVQECNGNQLAALDKAFTALLDPANSGKPKALLARTKKGYGISFMEGDNRWHYTRVDKETLTQALKELG